MIEKLKRHEEKFSTVSTAIVCCMAMMVVSLWSYEEHLPAVIMNILNPIAVAMAFIMWLYASFMRGLVKKTGFAIFTAFYFVLPVLISNHADTLRNDPSIQAMNTKMIGDYCKLLGKTAFEHMPIFSRMESVTAAVVFSSMCIAVFIIGMFLGSKEQIVEIK